MSHVFFGLLEKELFWKTKGHQKKCQVPFHENFVRQVDFTYVTLQVASPISSALTFIVVSAVSVRTWVTTWSQCTTITCVTFLMWQTMTNSILFKSHIAFKFSILIKRICFVFVPSRNFRIFCSDWFFQTVSKSSLCQKCLLSHYKKFNNRKGKSSNIFGHSKANHSVGIFCCKISFEMRFQTLFFNFSQITSNGSWMVQIGPKPLPGLQRIIFDRLTSPKRISVFFFSKNQKLELENDFFALHCLTSLKKRFEAISWS